MSKSLYCVKFFNCKGQVIDVQHLIANNYKEVHARLDKHMLTLRLYNILDYDSYSFFRVQEVAELINEAKTKLKNDINSCFLD